MWSRLFLVPVLLGAMTLNGCDQPGQGQAQANSQTAPLAQPESEWGSPQALAAAEFVPEEETVTWLDEADDAVVTEIEWDTLIPEDWRPETLFDDAGIEYLSDDDPRAKALLEKLRRLWDEAPIVAELGGQRVRLPGFVVPLEMDATKINEFLLVPYFGACIHVPPPPANQIVHVVMREGKAFEGQLFDTVWVTGTMQIERLSSDLGAAGYRMDEATVTPYEVAFE